MDWKRGLTLGLLVVTGFSTLPGCATIASDKKYEVTFDNPGGPTQFAIRNHKNKLLYQGMTPEQITLPARSYPFWPARYDVTFTGNGNNVDQQVIKAKFDPWVAGNIIAGGLIGLTVDGFTGAMFQLPGRLSGKILPQYASGASSSNASNIAMDKTSNGVEQASFVQPGPGSPDTPGICY